MSECGTVIAVRPGEVDIEFAPSEACAGCKACDPAGGGMRMERVPVDREFRVGQSVSVEIDPRAKARARVLVFLVPVIALVGGYLAGFLLGGALGTPSDATGAATALIMLATAMTAVSVYDRGRESRGSGDVRVHAIISQAKSGHPDEEDRIRD